MLTPGSTFAGYRVERRIGRGGMGEVYLARHPRLPRSDALKLMSEELSRNEIYRQRFSAEADLACQVQHESVVRVYDRGEDDGRLWLAMEYVEGRDLAEVLAAEGRLPFDRAVGLVERIASALDAIHARGLLHRDVKPANILVASSASGSERALLTDFGIARSAADSLGLTGVGDIVATLHYAAPEQFEMRSGELDRRVDVYALGCVLYEMITGRVPLQGDSVASFWHTMQTEVPSPPSREVAGIPTPLDAVVAKALSKRRDDRYSTAGELARAARDAISVSRTLVTGPPILPTPPVQAPPTAVSSDPHRIGLRRDDAAAPGGFRQFGPIATEELPPDQAQRLIWLISSSRVLTMPSALGGWGPSTALTVEAPGQFHTVAWNGAPPPTLAELASEVERLGGYRGTPPPFQPSGGARSQPSGHGPKRRGRGKLLAVLGGVVVLIAAAVVTVLLLSSKKPVPGVPGGVTVTAGRGEVTIHWTPSSGTTDHYVVYEDGRQIGTQSPGATTFTVKAGDTASHNYAVQAVNHAGRTSAISPPVRIQALVRPLTAPEKALLAKLPSGLVSGDSCEPILTGIDTHLSMAITCGPGAGQSPSPPAVVPSKVEVYGAANLASMKSALADQIAMFKALPGACSTAPQQGTWNFTETPKVLNGQIVCYVSVGKSYLLWSYNSALFYVRISSSSPYADLLKYWQNASLHLP
ncbi:MAG TPA: protein kinase [Frankiaceae bacterium]|jgi:serine/threonine protein kinase|nr:protein kinase [Frankiaceae bacterium]